MATWIKGLGVTRASLMNAARTAIATLISLMVARMLKLNEFYWAPISTIVILLSTINPMAGSWQRFVGTALGAALGALIATYFKVTWIVYGAGIFLCGILCAILRIKESYRIAAITLSIVLLITHGSCTMDGGAAPLHRSINRNSSSVTDHNSVESSARRQPVMKTILHRILVFSGLVLLSILCAWFTDMAVFDRLAIDSPGSYMAMRLIEIPSNSPDWGPNLPRMGVEIGVDTFCWFVLIILIRYAVKKLKHKT